MAASLPLGHFVLSIVTGRAREGFLSYVVPVNLLLLALAVIGVLAGRRLRRFVSSGREESARTRPMSGCHSGDVGVEREFRSHPVGLSAAEAERGDQPCPTWRRTHMDGSLPGLTTRTITLRSLR